MVNYTIILALAAMLSLLVRACGLALVLQHAIRHVRQAPIPAREFASLYRDGSTIPYAPAECRPPLLVRHPWIATVLCGIAGTLPLAVIAILTWRYLPAPLRSRFSNGTLTLISVSQNIVAGDDVTVAVASNPLQIIQPTIPTVGPSTMPGR